MDQNLNTQSKATQNSAAEGQLTSSQIAAYLLQHPKFFEQHLRLLEHMTIPHPAGGAVSLISKQLELFRNRHHDLESKLNELIEIAQENDALSIRIHELTLAMLQACTLEDAVTNSHKVLMDCFLSDFVALKIFHKITNSPIANVFVGASNDNLQMFEPALSENQPRCGKPSLAERHFLFNENADKVKSCAIIPMTFSNLQGVVAIGSHETDRFHEGMGHLFLSQMGAIIGTRLSALLSARDASAHS